MKYRIIFILFATIALHYPSFAQSFGGSWESSEIEMDSLQPGALFFMDSVHGLFCGKRIYPTYKNIAEQSITPLKLHWFRTSDGGNTWHPLDLVDLGYVDTGWTSIVLGLNEVCTALGSKVVYLPNSGLKNDPSTWWTKKKNLLLSKDYGEHWQSVGFLGDSITTNHFYLMGSLGHNLINGYDKNNGSLYSSGDYGKTFFLLNSDSIFRFFVRQGIMPDTTYVNRIGFAYSDYQHFTLVNNSIADGHQDSNITGLTTLVTLSGGVSWNRYNYKLPGFENKMLHGSLQYISGTPHLYFFPCWMNTEGEWNEIINIAGQRILVNSADSYYNTSFMFSSDYGMTWTPNHSFGDRRRGFEAVAKNEVWMTVTPAENFDEFGRKASIITRTMDNGVTWEEDSLTLNPQDYPQLDGRIIASSDPRHVWIAAYNGRRTYILRYRQGAAMVDAGDPQMQEFRVKIYPNPADAKVTILVDKSERIKSIEVYDPLGRGIVVPVKIGTTSGELSTQSLSRGCYLVRVYLKRGPKYLRTLVVTR